ncbi:MAG: hypothetical protein AAGJ35_01260 [Myxococcota bacterium]
MVERYDGSFSQPQREALGQDLEPRFEIFMNGLPTEQQSILNQPWLWMKEAHRMFVEALSDLRREIGEEKALRVLQINRPERLREGVDMIFKTLAAIKALSVLHETEAHQEEVEHATQVVTQGKNRSELTNQEAMSMFVAGVHQQLPTQKILHYKNDTFSFVDEVDALNADLLQADKDLKQEIAETVEARREVWKAAKQWDKMYRMLKFATRCVLISLDREHEYTRMFNDRSSSTSKPKASTPSADTN